VLWCVLRVCDECGVCVLRRVYESVLCVLCMCVYVCGFSACLEMCRQTNQRRKNGQCISTHVCCLDARLMRQTERERERDRRLDGCVVLCCVVVLLCCVELCCVVLSVLCCGVCCVECVECVLCCVVCVLCCHLV